MEILLANLPAAVGRVIEPFAGGCALAWRLQDLPALLNDASAELMAFYRHVAEPNEGLHRALEAIAQDWEALNEPAQTGLAGLIVAYAADRSPGWVSRLDRALHAWSPSLDWSPTLPTLCGENTRAALRRSVTAKIRRMCALEERRGQMSGEDVQANIVGAAKAGYYNALRQRYNALARSPDMTSPEGSALFFFVREYAYASMFRYNARGEFNVPFGGISYARKSFAGKVQRLRAPEVVGRLQRASMVCGDFETFLEGITWRTDDLVFVDPPYDAVFSSYGTSSFGAGDHVRLARSLQRLQAKASVMIVVRRSALMESLYPSGQWFVRPYPMAYRWTIKARNERSTEHLMVTNYAPGSVP